MSVRRWSVCGCSGANTPMIAQRSSSVGETRAAVNAATVCPCDVGLAVPACAPACAPACHKGDLTFKRLRIYRTEWADSNQRIQLTDTIRLKEDTADTSATVLVLPEKQLGKPWLGFGGSFTEAAAVSLAKMPESVKESVIKAYFSQDPEEGNCYSLGRMHIASCDFSESSWDCGPGGKLDEGKNLSDFSLDKYDDTHIFEMLGRAQTMAGETRIKLLASPWSPPAFMKTTGNRLEGGKLKEEFRELWALHYVKFIQEMQKRDHPIWAVTVQNEPEAKQNWESCIYTAEEEMIFVRDFLGPALRDNCLSAKVKVVVHDHNRDTLPERVSRIYSDKKAAESIYGAGIHWYGDPRFETWPCKNIVPFIGRDDDKTKEREFNELKGQAGFNNVRCVAEAYPDKRLIFTEGCQELGKRKLEDVQGRVDLGERYFMNFCNDASQHVDAWIDWNLILNQQGGPNHQGNFCVAPIICNSDTKEVQLESPYFYMGQCSRYIRPGARRVIVSSGRDALEVISFINTDNSLATVVMNPSEDLIKFQFKIAGSDTRTVLGQEVEIKAHSIITLVADAGGDDDRAVPPAAGVVSATRTLFNQLWRKPESH